MVEVGDKGKHVGHLQQLINYNYSAYNKIDVDGMFGNITRSKLIEFQGANKLAKTGVADSATYQMLLHKSPYPNISQYLDDDFLFVIDWGHSGYSLEENSYLTPGKRYNHPSSTLMHHNGMYYEGVENRMVGMMVHRNCIKHGINCITLADPILDTSLSKRAELVGQYIQMGYSKVVLFSVHSNAVSTENRTQKELDAIRGLSVWTTYKDNLSDEVAQIHADGFKREFQGVRVMEQLKDGDSDYEANFKILKDSENLIPANFVKFASVLEEFDIHTSKQAAEFIVQNREKRAANILNTAIKSRELMSG